MTSPSFLCDVTAVPVVARVGIYDFGEGVCVLDSVTVVFSQVVTPESDLPTYLISRLHITVPGRASVDELVHFSREQPRERSQPWLHGDYLPRDLRYVSCGGALPPPFPFS